MLFEQAQALSENAKSSSTGLISMNGEWYTTAFPPSLTVYNSMKERLSFQEICSFLFHHPEKKNKNRFHPAALKRRWFSAESFDKGSSFTCSIAESGNVCFFRKQRYRNGTAPVVPGTAVNSFFGIHPRLCGTAVPTDVVLCCFVYRAHTVPKPFS